MVKMVQVERGGVLLPIQARRAYQAAMGIEMMEESNASVSCVLKRRPPFS